MKRTSFVFAVTILFFLFLTGWFLGPSRLDAPKPVAAQGIGPSAAVDPILLEERLGYLFVPAGPLDHPSITQDQAIAIAKQNTPSLSNATAVRGVLGRLSNPGLQEPDEDPVKPGHADMGLVWLLSFVGITSTSSGPPNFARHTSDELVVVVSADTSKEIMQFVYRSSSEQAIPTVAVTPPATIPAATLPSAPPTPTAAIPPTLLPFVTPESQITPPCDLCRP